MRDLGTAFGFAVAYDSSTNSTVITSGKVSLVFNDKDYTIKTVTFGDKTITYRAYENIIYVSNPVDANYQIMNVYIPEEYFEGKNIGSYNAANAPIFLPNKVGGYMPAKPDSPGFKQDGSPNASLIALSKGYVVASPGARGRTLKAENGMNTGKAPACIVDLKAAVRYLRYNDKIMPGSAERIISNGTSAGGAISSLLGATGNNADYEPYLEEIGAAATRDDIFAASCYCPITNLDNSDTAYEWEFNGVNEFNFAGRQGTLTEEQIKISNQLKAMFPAYVNSLGLKKADGTPLTLDSNGNGPFKDYVKSFLIASAQKALNKGVNLSAIDALTIKDGKVVDIDFEKYIKYITRMKPTPAFDALDLSSWENSLFGTATVDSQHFTKFSKENSTKDGTLADAKIIKMMNPMYYIGTKGTTTAKYWRIRHGAMDRDTSFAIPVILATKLQNEGYDVDFEIPWGVGHGGDYDLEELFNWIEETVKKAK
ncbi:subtype B tannase [Thermovenabulum sp.]|uniref:subtype B tannase n=1 Tax=Thermovenabulum sp. TaxID=3100335 RepID=UPI003C7B52C4